ncbi:MULTISPECIES: class I SAM-dependent methyltransferase [Halorubrum]|uniref:Methyltransferase domain-containing protein n=1 Tax=Halorubrum sodomense TaxID=35743 RepID=A0A1I6H690_HALSD|nr:MULTISPECIES: class I SAM-dependent methyltransferase [Halorubrum]TKX55734.1 class I SAM-dependent methyltransferase [Halorubrum sp. SP3]TKX71482.1 class I SAM-dependent methyltransferase [Halorubrum sp. SP9]SFR50009.1 Methyltransferase domain-containing protein [Halorubrum sodomense]
MKKTVEEHAERFSEKAAAYDDSKSDEYHACASLVIDHAAPESDDVVLDLGAGTGAIALAVAADAERVLARDISEGMMEEGRRKAADRGLDNVEFAYGEFRDPDLDPDQRVDVVTSNFALHHLADDEKREAIRVMSETGARRIALGDVAFFEGPDPDAPFYSPEVDDPATVGTLVEAFTEEGFAVTAVERVHDQVAVIVAERLRELPA